METSGIVTRPPLVKTTLPTETQMDITTRRKRLDELLEKRRDDEIPSVEPSVTILEDRKRSSPNEDCISYAFPLRGINVATDLEGAIMNAQPLSAENAKPGDYVLYFTEDGNWTHIGVLRQRGEVESKWGNSHVFKHPIELVPASYGNVIRTSAPE